MIRRRFALAGAAALTTFAVVRGPARAAQFEFRCGSGLPIDHPSSVRGKQMWAAIESESGGRIKAQFFPNSQLGGNIAMISQVRVGAIQFVTMSAGDLNTVVPAVDITNVGFAFKDVDEALRAVDGPLGDYMHKEVVAKNIYPLKTIWDSGIRQMFTSPHPVRTADDMVGLKIRVVESRITVDFFRTLGATPTPMGANETYTAMQTHIVDGCDFPVSTAEAYHFYEVQKYLSMTNHSWSCLWQIANADAWKNLPPDLQAVIERNNTKYGLLARRDSKVLNAATGEKLVRQGMTMNQVDPTTFRAKLGPYYGRWANEFGATQWGLLRNSITGRLG